MIEETKSKSGVPVNEQESAGRRTWGEPAGLETDMPLRGGADLPPDELRAALHRVSDMIADYLEHVESYSVIPRVAPGEFRGSLPAQPPDQPEPIATILDDYRRLVEPNVTHWNHPAFFAYFAITGSGPGILGEALAAALNVNTMLWRTGPAPTELEELVCDWLRQMLDLPAEFRGHINDTASIGTFLALAAARHRTGGEEVRTRGLAGRGEGAALTVHVSEHAHSSVDKAAIALGLGLDNVRRVATDEAFRMVPVALEESLARARAAGELPIAVVATAGTTSTTSVDPVRSAAEICRRHGLWLHVDAAYGGGAAICPEYRKLLDGLELADSLVVNPHKWLFTPTDCSVLLLREPDALRRAFALVPEYLRTDEPGVTNLMDYGIQLGRRFRALKLWMVIRAFGVEGLRARIRSHCTMARELAEWIAQEPGFEVAAPVPFSVVCFRATPTLPPAEQDTLNERLLAQVNASGSAFLSHTRLHGRFVLRLAIGNLRTTPEHVHRTWELIRRTAGALQP